ncbi:Unknown protein sequence [Pseudomonas syringae pv. maculicola]|nr:Unknown protein sequence [Pseudomonas syringae pv. maculicola]
MSVTHGMSPGSCCEGVCVDSAVGYWQEAFKSRLFAGCRG